MITTIKYNTENILAAINSFVVLYLVRYRHL